jgi:hypothetical protein
MNETKNVLIFAVALLIALVFFCLGTRYQMVATAANDSHYVYMYDRLTGKIWVVLGTFPDYYLPVLGISDHEAKKIMLEQKNK